MDLNYLFSRHQVSIMRAGAAACAEARHAHHALAERYALRIQEMQQSAGAGMTFSPAP